MVLDAESASGCSRIREKEMAPLRMNEERSALLVDVQTPGIHPLGGVDLTRPLEFSDLGFQGTR